MLGLVTKWLGEGRLAMKTPRTFDYTKRGWGHDISFTPIDGGMKMRANGWGPKPADGDELQREYMEPGDFLILAHPGGQETTRYRIDKIEYMHNPRDQWFADLSFAPRQHVSPEAPSEQVQGQGEK